MTGWRSFSNPRLRIEVLFLDLVGFDDAVRSSAVVAFRVHDDAAARTEDGRAVTARVRHNVRVVVDVVLHVAADVGRVRAFLTMELLAARSWYLFPCRVLQFLRWHRRQRLRLWGGVRSRGLTFDLDVQRLH